MRASILAPLVLLAACATRSPPPDVKTVEVKVPVAVSCVPKGFPEASAGLSKAWAAARVAEDAGDLLAALGAYAKLAHQRLAETEPLVAACR